MTTFSRSFRPASARTQRGAVLYVALIMLILLALLGIAGMQVAGMQEKMAANYRAANRAFQNSEGVVRAAERSVEKIANRQDVGNDSLVQSSTAMTASIRPSGPKAAATRRVLRSMSARLTAV